MSRRAGDAKREGRFGFKSVHFSDELVFHECVKENDYDTCVQILSKPDRDFEINDLSNLGLSALHLAAIFGHLRIVQLLVDHGADINLIDEEKWTPLHVACAESYPLIARYLVDKGARLDVRNDEGKLPQDLIVENDATMQQVMEEIKESSARKQAEGKLKRQKPVNPPASRQNSKSKK